LLEPIHRLTMFLTFSSTFFLSSIAVLCSGQEMSTRLLAEVRGIEKPEIRYEVWKSLDGNQKFAAGVNLDYTEITWNRPGTNDVEFNTFDQLTDDNKLAASSIGIDDAKEWDCWINHYVGKTWDELGTEGVQEYYVVLGWNEFNWQGDELGFPKSEAKDYDELSSKEKDAAQNVCFDELLWDGGRLDKGSASIRLTASTTVMLATAAMVGSFFL
jgi:hypothetical protein